MNSSDFLSEKQEIDDKVDHDAIGKIAACIGLSVTSFAAMHAVIGLSYSPHLKGSYSLYEPILFIMGNMSVAIIYVTGFLSSGLLYVSWLIFIKSRYGLKIDSYAKTHKRLSWRHLPIILAPLIVILVHRNFYLIFGSQNYYIDLILFVFSVVLFIAVGLRYSDRLISFAWLSSLRDRVIFLIMLLFTIVSAIEAIESKKSAYLDQTDGKMLEFCRNYPAKDLDFIDAKEQVYYKVICDKLLSDAYFSAFRK